MFVVVCCPRKQNKQRERIYFFGCWSQKPKSKWSTFVCTNICTPKISPKKRTNRGITLSEIETHKNIPPHHGGVGPVLKRIQTRSDGILCVSVCGWESIRLLPEGSTHTTNNRKRSKESCAEIDATSWAMEMEEQKTWDSPAPW